MTLTSRQREILEQYVETGSQQETAQRLGIALPTVKNSLLKVRRQHNVRSTAQLVYMLAAGEFDS